MNFGANNTPIEIIKEGTFGGTYFRDILESMINGIKRYWLGGRSIDGKRQIDRWKIIVSRFKSKLVKIIKTVNVRFDDYLFNLKLEKFFCIGAMSQLKVIRYDLFFVHINMNYYFFNRQELLQKVKNRYNNCGGKENAAIC